MLYWDKIDFPQNNIIAFDETPEIQYLKNAGIMQQTNVNITESGDMTDLYLKAQLKALKINNNLDQNLWTLGQENMELVLPKDELMEFRNLMDNFYLELLKSGDSERAMTIYVEKIKRKLVEIDCVMNESMFKRIRSNVKVSFDLKESIANTFIGLTGGHQIGFPKITAIAGFMSSFININAEILLKPKHLSDDLKDYAYLYYAREESVIK